MGTNQTTKETRRASYDAIIPKVKERSRLIPGNDFDPVTGEIYEPEDDRRTNDGQTEEQPKNDGKRSVV